MLSDVLACALWETETASKTAHYNKNKKKTKFCDVQRLKIKLKLQGNRRPSRTASVSRVFILYLFLLPDTHYCNILFVALLIPFSYEDKRLAQH